MTRDAPRWRAALWWVVPVVALGLVLGVEADWGRKLHRLPEPPPTVDPKPVASALLPEYRIEGGLAAHAETVNRTLFNPTRRPAPTTGAGGPRQMQRGQFVLTGTAVTGERKIAFLKEISGGKSRSVRQGETINGLLVASVSADRVRLTLGDESEELVLKVAPGPKTTVAPPSMGAPGAPGAAAPGAPPATAPVPAPGVEPQAAELQRRRAAAAASAAAAAAAGNPPVAGQAVAPSGAAPATTAPQSVPEAVPASADPAWNEVYERMRQRNPNYPK